MARVRGVLEAWLLLGGVTLICGASLDWAAHAAFAIGAAEYCFTTGGFPDPLGLLSAHPLGMTAAALVVFAAALAVGSALGSVGPGPTLTVLGVAALAFVNFVEIARRRLIQSGARVEDCVSDWNWADGGVELTKWFAIVALFTLLLVATGVVRGLADGDRDLLWAAVPLLGALTVCVAAGLGVALMSAELILGAGHVSPADLPFVLDALREEAVARADLFQGLLGAIGLVAAGIATVAQIMRDSSRAPAHAVARSSLLFAIGVALFVRTRALAFDTRHPFPYRGRSGEFWASHTIVSELPPLSRCETGELSGGHPLVWIEGTEISLSDRKMSGAREIGDKLDGLKRQFMDLHLMAKDPPLTQTFAVGVAASRHEPAARVVGLFAAAPQAGYDTLCAVSSRTLQFETRAHGTLSWLQRCQICFQLTTDGEPVSNFATWGDLAGEASRRPLKIAPLSE